MITNLPTQNEHPIITTRALLSTALIRRCRTEAPTNTLPVLCARMPRAERLRGQLGHGVGGVGHAEERASGGVRGAEGLVDGVGPGGVAGAGLAEGVGGADGEAETFEGKGSEGTDCL